MKTYRITFLKENGGKYISTVVDAKSEQDAFLKARKVANEKGIELPDEVWTRTEIIGKER